MKARIRLLVTAAILLVASLAAAPAARAEVMPFQTMAYDSEAALNAVAGQPHTFQFWLWHPDPDAVVTSGEIVFYRFVDDGVSWYHEYVTSVPITGIARYKVETDWSSTVPGNTFVWPELGLMPGLYEWCALVTVNGETNTHYSLSEGMTVYPPVAIDARAPFTRDPVVTVTYDRRESEKYFQITNSLSAWPDTWQEIPLDGHALDWTIPADGDGQKMVYMRFADAPGGSATTWSSSITLDRTGPRTEALSPAIVVRGQYATLKYAAHDLFSRSALFTIKVKTRSAHTVQTIKCGRQSTRGTLTKRFRCDLPRGTYTFYVYAVDLAGNSQSRLGSNTLTVR
jgi:hypothetical protein